MERSIKIFVGMLFILFSVTACATKFVPYNPPELKFVRTEKYSIDLSTIPKPDKIQPIFVDDNFKVVDAESAKYIVLAHSEYAKVAGLLKLSKAYKDIIEKQEILVNSNIDVINSLKEYVELEQLKAKSYRDLWADSENAYREEKRLGKIEAAITKGVMTVISIGSVIALIMAL